MAGPCGDGGAADCRKWECGVTHGGVGVLRVTVGHIGKASGKVQNVMGIICCNIGGIFLTSSRIRKHFFTVRVTEQ